MKKILYAGSELLTGDDIARAVLQYSEALAEVGSAETIEIPVRHPDGSAGNAMILVGPASQIVAVDVDGEQKFEELVDAAVVERLDGGSRRLRLRPTARTDLEQPPQMPWPDDL